jgi:hypothetical protein
MGCIEKNGRNEQGQGQRRIDLESGGARHQSDGRTAYGEQGRVGDPYPPGKCSQDDCREKEEKREFEDTDLILPIALPSVALTSCALGPTALRSRTASRSLSSRAFMSARHRSIRTLAASPVRSPSVHNVAQ